MNANVVRMIDHAPVAASGHEQIGDWLKNWAEHLADGGQGEIDTIVVAFQRSDGSVSRLSQSVRAMDTNTLIGFLQRMQFAIHLGEADLDP